MVLAVATALAVGLFVASEFKISELASLTDRFRDTTEESGELTNRLEQVVHEVDRKRMNTNEEFEIFKKNIASLAERERNQITNNINLEQAQWMRISELMNVGAEGFLATQEHANKIIDMEVAQLDQEIILQLGRSSEFLTIPALPKCSYEINTCSESFTRFALGLDSLAAENTRIAQQYLSAYDDTSRMIALYQTFIGDLRDAAEESSIIEAKICKLSNGDSCDGDLRLGESRDMSEAQPRPSLNRPSDNLEFAPSFDCSKAVKVDEKLICSSSEISRLDRETSRLYRIARLGSRDRQSTLRDQRAFLAERSKCFDLLCLKQVYEARVTVLKVD